MMCDWLMTYGTKLRGIFLKRFRILFDIMAIDDNDKDQPTPSETSGLTVMITTPNFVGVCEGSPTIRKGIERKIQLPVETILARWIYICIFMKNNSPKYIYIYIYALENYIYHLL